MSSLFTKVASTASTLAIVTVAMGSSLTALAMSEFAMHAGELADAGVITTQSSEAGYRLGDNITRAELAKIAVNLSGETATTCVGDVFKDVTSAMGDLCGYVEAAAEAGIVSKANSNFRPTDLVTRAEMIKMLLASQGVAPTDVSAGFSDVTASMGDLAGYINAAVEEGLIKSGTSFRPNATATRGEAFKVAAGAMALDAVVEPPVVVPTTPTGTGVVVGTTTPTATGDVMVSLNPATPAATTLATGSAYNKVLVVDMKAGSKDAAITGIEVTRTGLLSNSNVAGISVWVDGSRLGNVAQSLTSDGKATVTFGSTPLAIAAGATKTVTIALNVKTGVYSGTVGLTLSKVMAGGTVTGAPVASAVHSVVDGTQALVQYNVSAIAVGGALTEGAAVSLDIGQATELAKFKVEQTNSKEDLKVEGMNVFIEGSVADGDLDTLQVVSQEGNVLASAATTSGRYVNFKFTAPYSIPQGSSRFFTVKASVAAGKYNANRTYSAKIRDDFDVVAMGAVTGTYVLATTIPTTQYWFKVREGTVTVAKATDSRSQSAAPGIDDVVLGTFDVKASGEDMEFQKLNFKVTKVTGTSDLRGTLKMTVDGVTVFSTDAATATNYTTGANPGYLSTYFTVKAGSTAKVAIVASIKTTATLADSYRADLIDSSYKLISSNSIKTLTLTGTNGNTIAVENVTLTASNNGAFAASTLVRGQTNAKIGSFNLQASNADDLNVTTVRVGLNTASVTGMNNLTLKMGTTTIASAIANPTLTGNTFSINGGALKVSANSTVTIDVYADVTSAATAPSVQAQLEANGTSAVGVKTSVSVTGPTLLASSAVTDIVGNGTLTIESDSLTPAKQILVAGMTNVEVLRFKVRANNQEDIRLDKLDIGAAVGNTATIDNSLVNVKLFDGATQVGGGSVTFVAGVAKFTGLNFVVPKAGSKSLSLRADTTGSAVLSKGMTLQVAPVGMEYTGVAGGSLTAFAAVANTLAPSATMLLQDVKLVIASQAVAASGKSTAQDLAAYTLKAEGARDATVSKIVVVLTTSNATGAISAPVLRYNNTDYQAGVVVSATNVNTVTFTLATPITVTAGTTVSFGVRANTTALSVVANQGSAHSISPSIAGVSGVVDASNGIEYSYTDANAGASGTINTSDSYPANAPTIQY
jgi:S-layer homology domain